MTIMHINITRTMITIDTMISNNIKFSIQILILLFVSGCSVVPGMNIPKTGIFGDDYIYIKDAERFIKIVTVTPEILEAQNKDIEINYLISPGDVLTVVVWGQPEAFPVTQSLQINHPINARTVDANGEIFFPFAGNIEVKDLTIEQARELITSKLASSFMDPQVDVTVTKYNNNRRAFLLGEISQPKVITLGIEQINLTSAIAEARGINMITSDPESIYIIRGQDNEEIIYKINLKTPAEFLLANEFYLQPKDVIFIGTASITRWNRLIGQFFPFASLVNQVDQISNRD